MASEVTRLLLEWKDGNTAALEMLTPLVYNELRRLADIYLRDERHARTLQPTALVNEAYLRLVASDLPDWHSRAQFFAIAAHRMRQILVEHARRHNTTKRGKDVQKVALNEAIDFAPQHSAVILELNDALDALARFDERKSRIIELRFFAGMSVEETAQALGISTATVSREQRFAEAWLANAMSPKES